MQIFRTKPSVAILKLIVIVAGSDHRSLINWSGFLEGIKNKKAILFVQFSSVWARRSETMCIHEYLWRHSSDFRAGNSPYQLYFGPQMQPEECNDKNRLRTTCDMHDWIDSPTFSAVVAINWIIALKIDPIDFILRGLVSMYCNNTYLIEGKPYHLQRAKEVLLLWIKTSPSQSQVGFTKGELKAMEMMSYWPACQVGHAMILGRPNEERQKRVREWNDWVDKNISVWIR